MNPKPYLPLLHEVAARYLCQKLIIPRTNNGPRLAPLGSEGGLSIALRSMLESELMVAKLQRFAKLSGKYIVDRAAICV